MKAKIKYVTSVDLARGIRPDDIVEIYESEVGNGYFTTNGIFSLFPEQIEIISETDPIVDSVIEQFKERSKKGFEKYGHTLERKDLSTLEWINEAQQEAMDFCLYLERLKKEFKNENLHIHTNSIPSK